MADFITKDSGQRVVFPDGMRREPEAGKPRFDLINPRGVPYGDRLLTRIAKLYARGAEGKGERNWERAESREALDRFESSALRHMMQWLAGETDEDHAAAVFFNVQGAELVRWKMAAAGKGEPIDLLNPEVHA